MQIFCIEEFKIEFEKLLKKKTYNDIESELIKHIFDKNIQDLSSGIRLNNSTETPYIKKRLNGSGGDRLYYYAIIKNDSIYLMFVHPKTGNLGSENITDESKAYIYKRVLECIKSNNLYSISRSLDGRKIQFSLKK